MRTQLIIASLIIAISLLGCEKNKDEDMDKELTFTTFQKSNYCRIEERKFILIDYHEKWEEVWGELSLESLKIPYVDFNKNSLIAVFMGNCSTGGYNIEIVKITEGKNINVFYKQTYPSADDYVTMATTVPYHIVMVDKVIKEVKFNEFL